MVQTEHEADHKRPPVEHTSPTPNTSEKLSSVLNNRTFRDKIHQLDPYKRNTSGSPTTTLTHIIHCYDRLLFTTNL